MIPNFDTSAPASPQLTSVFQHRDGILFYPLHSPVKLFCRKHGVCNEASVAFYCSRHQYGMFLLLWLVVLWNILPSEEDVNWPQSLAHIKTYNFNPMMNIGQPRLFIFTIAAVMYVSCENNRFVGFNRRMLCVCSSCCIDTWDTACSVASPVVQRISYGNNNYSLC